MFSEKIERLKTEHQELAVKVADPKNMSDQRQYSKISSRFGELEKILTLADVEACKKSYKKPKRC